MSDKKASDKKASEHKTSDKLLPCPFCGGEAELYSYEAERVIYDSDTLGYVDTEYFTKYGVSCTGCNCLMAEYKSEEHATAEWNTRKPMERIVEKIKKNGFWTGELYDKVMYLEKAIEIVKEEGVD